MFESTEITFKPTFFSTRHKIVLNRNFIEFYQSAEDKNPVKFTKLEIDAFRFGIRWLRGYKIIFGRIFCIDIRNVTGAIIKVRLMSVYRINAKQLHEKYSSLINIVLQCYASDMVAQYLKMFNSKQPFSILNIQFKELGIVLDDKYDINWNNIDVRAHTRYIAISTKAKSTLYKTFDYIEEWNTLILYNVLRQILKNKKLLN